jgi:ribonuclease HIII
VVAAASIVARVHFLEGIKRCEEACACELHKGAGDPVDKAARRVMAIGGSALLARVAKMHFKNSERAGARQP